MPQCKSCNQEILWMLMESGKSMPVDAKPVGINLINQNSEGKGVVQRGPSFMPHWATCPHANRHSKKPSTSQQQELF